MSFPPQSKSGGLLTALLQYARLAHSVMPKVFMMMSGGVDSSVAASLLLEQGYEVVGVFMKCWSVAQLEALGADESLNGCFWEDDAADARQVADKLGIPFYVWDFQAEYKQGVVDYMLEEYAAGRTPNPDVMCNSVIKFGIFYQRAMGLGADFVATGHYVRTVHTADLDERIQPIIMLRAKDKNKDQSYFLWRIKPTQLEHCLFPIGEFENKSDVRKKADELGLVTASKPDSQGLCFIGETPLRELLLQTLGRKEGKILDSEERVLGTHPGAYLYTIGQRNGLGLSGGPWFVSGVEIESNVVRVTHLAEPEPLLRSELQAVEPNWLSLEYEHLHEFECEAQVRYRQKAVACRVIKQKSSDSFETTLLQVIFSEPVRAISRGQSIVFYAGEKVLGGAIIV